MQLSKEAIEDYKKAFKEEFGEDLSDEEAMELGCDLLRLFQIIYRPIPLNKKKEFEAIKREYERFMSGIGHALTLLDKII